MVYWQVCTDEAGCAGDADSAVTQAHRERERTEARFLSDQLLEEGRWHHVMVVLNKALIRNSTCALFVDGKHVATCRVSKVLLTSYPCNSSAVEPQFNKPVYDKVLSIMNEIL